MLLASTQRLFSQIVLITFARLLTVRAGVLDDFLYGLVLGVQILDVLDTCLRLAVLLSCLLLAMLLSSFDFLQIVVVLLAVLLPVLSPFCFSPLALWLWVCF